VTPASDAIRRKATEIVSRADYELRPRPDSSEWMRDLLWEALEWILKPFVWLFGLTEGLPEPVRWLIMIALTVLLVVLTGHMIYSLVQAVQSPRRRTGLEEHALRGRADPNELERQAEDSAARGDYITAVRLLFRAGVLRLEKLENKPNRPGTTNRELLRRYQRYPKLAESLRSLVDTIDRKWYGEEQCLPNDYAVCRVAHEVVCRYARGSAHVQGA
jgi:hypothetical protein